MPLFESIEGDLTAFFVSQGSVFDALVKSFMDRVARVEGRVDALALDSAARLQSVSQQVQALSAAADAHAAATLARLEHVSQTATTMATMAAAAAATAAAAERSNANAISDTSNASNRAETSAASSSHEFEYYVMTLARQLHVVLELFFQPHVHDMVEGIQSKQARFESISDVLTQNEAVIMQLSAASAPPQEPSHNGELVGSFRGIAIESIQEAQDEAARSDTAVESSEPQSIESSVADQEAISKVPSSDDRLEPDDMVHPMAVADLETSEAVEKADEVETASVPDTIHRTRSQLDRLPTLSKRSGTNDPTSRRNTKSSRKKSLYDSFRDFHELQQSEAERERQKEKELLRKMQHMLTTARKHWRDEVASTLTLAWQEKMRELESHQVKMQSEWKYLQEQQPPHDLVLQQQQQQQSELDRQLSVLSESLLAAQRVQELQIAQVLESLRAFQDQYVSKADFDSLATAWLQAARDECVFGVDADALATLKQEMEAFHAQLVRAQASETSPLLEQLLGEVGRVLEILGQLLELLASDGAGLQGSKGFEAMQSLRTFLTVLDNLTQNLESDRDESARSAAFVSESLRQMELGTANLLEAFEAQQDRYRQAFEQQQRAIAQLERDLREQRHADEELKTQLAGCPSQEDTLRFIQELRDQIDTSTSDSATRMLETVDELRARMGGLPSAEIVERLAQAIQKKADRAEMDRLEKLLAAANSGPVAPVGSLMKAPMKCLSCDQSLPYMQSSGGASPEHNGASRYTHQHECSHDASERSYLYYADQAPQPTERGESGGLRDLFTTSSAAATRRRKQRQLHATSSAGGFFAAHNNWADVSRPSFVNLDDGRNRIPLRRAVLSDQVVYGPAITPNAFKRRAFASALGRLDSEQPSSSRPKTAIAPDRRGGEIITRSVSSTVVIRPFAEQAALEKQRAAKR